MYSFLIIMIYLILGSKIFIKVNPMILEVKTLTESTSSIVIDRGVNTCVTCEFFINVPVGGADSPIHQLRVADELALVEDTVIIFEEACIPDNPFYIKWVNEYGGWEYRMFCRDQEINVKLTTVNTFKPYLFSTVNAQAAGNSAYDTLRGEEVYELEAEESVKAWYTYTSKEDIEGVKGLLLSPEVMWWDEEVHQWIGIYIKKQNMSYRANSVLGDIELEFIMPAYTDL